MHRNQRILVALSLTSADATVLAYVRMLITSGIGRQYHFVHVPPPAAVAASSKVANTTQELEAFVAGHLNAIKELDFTCQVLTGVRLDALLEAATLMHADLILLGHRKSRSGQRSLARRLAMIAPCSVWMVPEDAPISIQQIMAPVDFSDNSADSLATAASLAKQLGLPRIESLHVIFDDLTSHYVETQEELRRDQTGLFLRFIDRIETTDVIIEPLVEESPNPAQTILRLAAEHHTDLLVMNTRGRSCAAAILLGSITTQVMIETPIAILVVKHFGAMLSLFQTLREGQFLNRSNPKTN